MGASFVAVLYQEQHIGWHTANIEHRVHTHSQTVLFVAIMFQEHHSGWHAANIDTEYTLTHRLFCLLQCCIKNITAGGTLQTSTQSTHSLTDCFVCCSLVSRTSQRVARCNYWYRVHTHSQTVLFVAVLYQEHHSGWHAANIDTEYTLTHRLSLMFMWVVAVLLPEWPPLQRTCLARSVEQR